MSRQYNAQVGPARYVDSYDYGQVRPTSMKRLMPLAKLKQELDRKFYTARVDLSFLNIDDSLGPEIRRFLEGNRIVTSLTLSGNLLTASGALDVIMGARLAPNLERLDLSHNLIGEWNGMQSKSCFEELFRRLRSNSSILELNLRGNRFKPFQAMYIADMVKINNWITHFDLSHNEFSPLGAHHLWEAFKYNNTCVDCQLSNTGVPSDVMLSIAERLRGNKSAQLFAKNSPRNSPRTPARPTSRPMSPYTGSTRATPMTPEKLVFSPVRRSRSASPKPERSIRDTSRSMIRENSGLWIGNNDCTQAELACIEQQEIENLRMQQSIRREMSNSRSREEYELEMAQCAAQANRDRIFPNSTGRDVYWQEQLMKQDYLTEVDLSGRCVDDKAAYEIALWLETNKFCRDLNLAGNRITGKGAAVIGRALLTNDTLVGLDLSDNPLGQLFGFMELCKCLMENDTMQVVLMRNCSLGGFHAHCLKDLFAGNRSITHVDIAYNTFGILGGELIRHGVEKNLKMVDLQLSACEIEHDQLIGVAQHLQENQNDANRRRMLNYQ